MNRHVPNFARVRLSHRVLSSSWPSPFSSIHPSRSYACLRPTTSKIATAIINARSPSLPVAVSHRLGSNLHPRSISHLARWRVRQDASSARILLSRGFFSNRRDAAESNGTTKESMTKSTDQGKNQPVQDGSQEPSTGNYFLNRLPHMHRPTREELLAAATGFWHRLQIRFKWFSIRDVRPFNLDDIGAFMSWIFLGHVIWIVIGTTTFVSLGIWALNTVFAQETLAGWVGNYLTKSSGIKVVFESAIVPTWKSGVITFKNVFVSRRPGQSKNRVSKGSQVTAATEAAHNQNWDNQDSDDDGNYSQFDVAIETVNVTLSFTKWFNGKGLLQNVEVRGVRGVIDRTFVQPVHGYVDPKSYLHHHQTGDFEIDDFRMEDVLLTVYQPNNFRPFTVSIFSCELPRLRKQWLFYDFLSANNISGSFDESLFTIHPRQVHGMTGASLIDGTELGEPGPWKKHSRLRIDGLNIDHLNRGVDGPFSWIQEGNVDIVADLMLPTDEDGSIAKVMSDVYDRMEATVTAQAHRHNHDIDHRHIHADETDTSAPASDPANDRYVIFDIRVHLNDVRASVPLFTNDLSYVSNALVRPIIAYINGRRSFIPINCRIVKRQNEFDGSWTVFDSGLLDDLSRETYDAFVRDISDERQRSRRIKKVGLWTIQLAAQALFIGLAGQLA